MTFAEALRAARLKKGYSQQCLGVRSGVSQDRISTWERGALPRQTAPVVAVAEALGIPPEEFLTPLKDEHRRRFPKLSVAGGVVTFAETLREARLNAGLGQRELARAAGIGSSKYNCWEHGALPRRTKSVLDLARALGADKNALLVPYMNDYERRHPTDDRNTD